MTKRKRKNVQPIDRGTQETRRQARRRGPSTIDRLASRGKIGLIELRAADEIERVFSYQSRALFSRSGHYGPREDRGYSDGDPAWFRSSFVDRYKPWANEGGQFVSVCINILVHGCSARELDRRHGWKKHTARDHLLHGLRRYCLIAGWCDKVTQQEWERKYGYGG